MRTAQTMGLFRAFAIGLVLSWVSVPALMSSRAISPELSHAIQSLRKDMGRQFELVPKAYALNNGGPTWAYVHQSATWARNNSNAIESIIGPIKASGILSQTVTVTGTSETGFKWRLTTNSPTAVAITALNGATKTFANKLELWVASSNVKAMELFFDDPSSTAGNGVEMLYSLNKLNPIQFPNNASMTESYTFGTAPNRKQVYGWSGAMDSTATPLVNAGRVILEEMDSGQTFCFKAVSKLQGSTLCGASGNDFYAIAYSQKQTGNNETVAKFSLNRTTVDHAGNLCGAANANNYGLFDNTGFVQDHVASGSIPANYPSYARIDANLSRAQAANGAWDDIEAATINAMAIAFKDPANAPF